MIIDFDDLSTSAIYSNLTQTIIPRPIAWVLSENAAGDYNLAPYSYFTPVCSDPPLLMISAGKKSDDTPKDTCANIRDRNEFVVHIAHLDMLKPLNASSATLPAEVSEVIELGLETEPFGDFRLPRLADCRVALGCERYEIQQIGAAPQSLIFGRVRCMYLDDAIADRDKKGRLKLFAEKFDPLSRLGADEYASLGKTISLQRPK